MSEWQPIETAPRKGNFLIAYGDGTVVCGHYLDNSHTRWPFEGVRPLHGAEPVGVRMTHWMPLPTPPSIALVDEAQSKDREAK